MIAGSIAVDEVYTLKSSLRAGLHLEGQASGYRLGGGAANTALPLAWMGHEVTVVSAAGTDAAGDWLVSELAGAGIRTEAIERVHGPSTRSLILIEPGGERTVLNVHRCRASLGERLATIPADAIYVRGRELDAASFPKERLDSCLVVSHIPPAEQGSRPAHILVASESDFSPAELENPWGLGRGVAGNALRFFVLTRGAAGATAYGRNERIEVPAPPAVALDSTGAGDVFAAGLLHGLVRGFSMEWALGLANSWGAATVESPGLPSPDRIRTLAATS